MKKSVLICFVIMFIFILICLYQIADLKNQVLSNFNYHFSYAQNLVGRSYSDLSNQIEEHFSLLSSKSFSYGDIDADTQSVTIHCVVTPKEYHPAHTAASLIFNDKEYPMELNNGEYSVSLPVSLLDTLLTARVQFTNDGTIQAETVHLDMSPRYDLLADTIVDFSGSTKNTTEDGIFLLHRTGEINIHVNEKSNDSSIQEIALIEYIDGEETARTSLPLSAVSSKQYRAPSLEPTAQPDTMSTSSKNFYYSLDKIFEIPFGSTFVLCVDLIDGYGFTHRTWIEYAYIDSSGANSNTPNYSPISGSDIHDEHTRFLWPIGDTIYR